VLNISCFMGECVVWLSVCWICHVVWVSIFIAYVMSLGECVCWICRVLWVSLCVGYVVFYG